MSDGPLFEQYAARAAAAAGTRASTSRTGPPPTRAPRAGAGGVAAKAASADGLETREGTVFAVRFEAPDGDFRVLSVRVGADIQAWVGKMPAVAKGQGVSATGRWGNDAKRGWQFTVEDLTASIPSGKEGLRYFLVGLGVKGLGPKTVDKLVEHFGDDLETTLDQPLLLQRCRGVNADLATRLTASWEEAKVQRAEVIELQSYGASALLANKIVAHYRSKGRSAIEVVKRNPYQLALDVDGVGFDTADQLALGMGLGADSGERVKAGALHVLHEATNKGHAYARRSDLTSAAAEMLGTNETRVEQALAWLAKDERAVIEPAGTGDAVFTPALHAAEVSVAARIATLLGTMPDRARRAEHGEKLPALPAGVDAAIADFEREAGVTLAPEQRDAVLMAATHKVLVLTGGPGVGKSACCSALLKLWKKARLAVELCAPTGRAAKRLSEATGSNAQTIHRLLDWDPQTRGFLHHAGNPIPTNVVLVDETSMCDVKLTAQLLEAIPDGARVVFVGDIDQLPSVGPGAVLRDLITSGVVPTVRLTRIFRQAKGSHISTNAARINAGETPVGDDVTQEGGEFFWFRISDPVQAQREIVDLVSRRIPERFGISPDDIQVLTPMHKHAVGTVELNSRLQVALNPGADRHDVTPNGRGLRVGDRVLVTKNNYDLEIYNGDIGKVVGVDHDDKDAALTVEIDGRTVDIPRNKLGDLQPAYAISIHKSQGGQFPCVVIPLSTQHYVLLSRNLLYTAVTRGKKLVVLVADPRAVRTALSTARKDDRQTRLVERLRAAVRA